MFRESMPYHQLVLELVLLVLYVAVADPAPTPHVTQQFVDAVAANLDVHFNVLNNVEEIKIEIILRNSGLFSITKGPWAIYFSFLHFPKPSPISENNAMVITQVNGFLHKMTPSSTFSSIPPGSQIVLMSHAQHSTVSKTDVMPNWFIAADGCRARVIKSTTDGDMNFVGGFKTKKTWRRSSGDTYDPYTPPQRYDMNSGSTEHQGYSPHVIPSPIEFKFEKNSPVLLVPAYEWCIESESGLGFEEAYLTDRLKDIGVWINKTASYKMHLHIDTKQENAEGYKLRVDAAGKFIDITGASSTGVFYGIQSLLSLLSVSGSLSSTEITDAPRYHYRGVQLDVARNFRPPDDVKLLLEAMGMYKLNKLHLHLTDDDGWRLEINGLLELTALGGRRCFDVAETTCLLPSLGSGPDSTTSGSGYYSTADYQSILKYAADRHIEIIPEFDSPGHGRAAIKAMQATHRNLLAVNETELAKKYLLSDMADTSRYRAVAGFTDSSINPCQNSTYNFIRHVVQEVVKLHKDINPLKTFHFGGDEVPSGSWVNSPVCKRLKTQETLKKYFVSLTAKIVHDAGLNLAGWEDGFTENQSIFNKELFPNKEVYGYPWNNINDINNFGRAHLLANEGYKTVISQASHLYLDHPYEPDPYERGITWATRFISTRKVFEFQPDNLFANVEKTNGAYWTKDALCRKPSVRCVELKKPENIIGMECHLWSETVRTTNDMHYMLFPRLLACAERAWHKAKWEVHNKANSEELLENWKLFVNTVGIKELKRLDRIGINYRVPPPGAIYVPTSNTVVTNVELPGLIVEYSVDKMRSWQNAENGKIFTGDVNGTLYLRTKSHLALDFIDGFTVEFMALQCPVYLVTTVSTYCYSSRGYHGSTDVKRYSRIVSLKNSVWSTDDAIRLMPELPAIPPIPMLEPSVDSTSSWSTTKLLLTAILVVFVLLRYRVLTKACKACLRTYVDLATQLKT